MARRDTHVLEQLGVSPETWRMAQGLKPPPEELSHSAHPLWRRTEAPRTLVGGKVMAMYPPESWPDDQDRFQTA